MGALTVVLLVVTIVLAAIAAFQPNVTAGGANRLHLGWLALAFFAMAHLV